MMLARDLPHHTEAEVSVIGSILIDNGVLPDILELLSVEDFYDLKVRKLYEISVNLYSSRIPVDTVTVYDALQKEGIWEEIGIDYIKLVIDSVPGTENVLHYANIVKERSFYRQMISLCADISEKCYSCDSNVSESIFSDIFELISKNKSSGIFSFRDMLYDNYKQLEEMVRNKKKFTGISTGFSELDERLSGLQNSDLILIAARPAMGKTSLALNIATNVAIKEKKPVLIFSLEMSHDQLTKRIISYESAIDSHSIRNANISETEFSRFVDSMDAVSNAPIYIDDNASVNVSGIYARAKRLKLEKNVGLVVIDYLQLMNGRKKSENRQVEIAEISRSLKILAKELNVPVIAVSQLSRAPESRADNRPVLSDLRESGAIEQDADVVLMLYRDEYYRADSKDKGVCEVNIAKHRAGGTGTIQLAFHGRYTGFYDFDRYDRR